MTNEERRLAAEAFGNGQRDQPSHAEKQHSMGAMEAMKDGFQAVMPGLNLDQIVRDIGQTLYQKGVQGLAELASAIYLGQSNAYVPYGQGQWMGRGNQAEKAGMDGEQGHDQGQQQQVRQGLSL